MSEKVSNKMLGALRFMKNYEREEGNYVYLPNHSCTDLDAKYYGIRPGNGLHSFRALGRRGLIEQKDNFCFVRLTDEGRKVIANFKGASLEFDTFNKSKLIMLKGEPHDPS